MISNLFKTISQKYLFEAKIFALIGLALVISVALVQAYGWAYKNGVNAERVAWQTSQNLALAEANKKLFDAEEQARVNEHLHAVQLNTISNTYQEKLTNEKQRHDSIVASLRAGNLSLRDKYAPPGNAAPGATLSSEAGAADSGRNATEGAKLSQPLAEFLIGLTSEADEVVNQLTACQAELLATHNACNTFH